MTEGVVAAQGQAAPLLRVDGLQSAVDTVRPGLELGDISKSLIERLLIGKRRKASIADVLVAVELHLVGFVQSARAHEVGAQIAARADLLLNTEIVLVVIRGLERSRGEGVQADGQRTGWCAWLDSRAGRAAGAEGCLKQLIGAGCRVDCACRNAGSNPQAAHLSPDAARKGGIVGSVHQAAIRNLLRDDVAEDAESGMNGGERTKLISNRDAWLVDKQRRCRETGCEHCRG